ncbi:porin, partial [Pseudomonas sp. FW301-21B01]|uniref:porin n=1 Tax=Pseudomonas sp. FW301-21B01 TaxID=2070624 RepID=UPI000CBA02D4
QYDALTELAAPYSASGWWVPATHIGDSDNFDGSVRINNSIKYRSPTLYGFTMQGMYALSNQAAGGTGGFANNRAWSVAANYV